MSILPPFAISHFDDYIVFKRKMKEKAEDNIISKLWCIIFEYKNS